MSVRKVLVYGGRGALGSVCVSKFKELNWVTSIYFIQQIIEVIILCISEITS